MEKIEEKGKSREWKKSKKNKKNPKKWKIIE